MTATDNAPTLADFVRWVNDTQIPSEVWCNSRVLAVLWGDFMDDWVAGGR